MGRVPAENLGGLPTPHLRLDSAFTHIYSEVCVQTCGFSGRDLRGGKQYGCAECLGHSHPDPEETSLLFQARPDGLCGVGVVVSSGTGCQAL